MKQKHFMDIDRARFGEDELTKNNISGFEVGDLIVIQEKVDGSNASFRYDTETGKLVSFSRKKELDYNNTLNGFFNWVQKLDINRFKDFPNYIFFGEWLTSHTIKYIPEAYNKFYFYDIYDVENECYLPQDKVKELSVVVDLIYVKTYYVGEFVSWEHCKSFMEQQSDISVGTQEGIVIKNQTKLNDPNTRNPFVVKLVNDKFSEIQKSRHIEKVLDPNKEAKKKQAEEIVDKIVTKNRVEKEIYKMRDEQLLPEVIEPKDMSTIAKLLPKRIYDDCVKEENDLVLEAGEFFGKMLNGKVMGYAKEIVLK